MHLTDVIQREARLAWPMPMPFPLFQTPTAPVALSRAAFDSLESLWDPRRSMTPSCSQVPPVRAEYEEDCDDWVRAPLSRRGILHLACLVQDSAIHVHDDHARAFHVAAFARRVPSLALDDEEVLAERGTMEAVARAAEADMLVDGGLPGHATLIDVGKHARCAWLVRDVRTGTWTARIFDRSSLTAPRRTVQTMAFALSAATSDSAYRGLVAGCRRSGIALRARAGREALLEHIRGLVSLV